MARITQRDIARIVGVSQATISIVLSGNEMKIKRIPLETRLKIQEVIKEHGYVVDPIARRMSKSTNKILGIFTYESAFQTQTRDFFTPFLLGIEEAAQELDYDILLLTGRGVDQHHKAVMDNRTRLRLADGCLILGQHINYGDLEKLHTTGYPFVLIGRRDDNPLSIPYVGADTRNATSKCVSYAYALGHTRLAYVGPRDTSEADKDRWVGFNNGLVNKEDLVTSFHDISLPPSVMLDEFIKCKATVVFCRHIENAIKIESEAKAQGMSIPEKLSIIVLGSHIQSHDNNHFTSFTIPRKEMGRNAVYMLVDAIERNNQKEHKLVSCPIINGVTIKRLK